MCERSTAATSPPATPSSVASRVRTSALLAEETACQGSGLGFGLNTCGWCRKCDPLGYSLRTCLRYALEASTPFLAGWSRKATPAGRSWWVLGTSERPTAGTGCSSSHDWPTPHANAANGAGAHGDGGLNLQTAVLWPTPTTAEAGKIGNQANYGQVALSNHPAIVGTPQRDPLTKSRSGVSQWPTPTAQDSVGSGSAGYGKVSASTGRPRSEGTTPTDATVGPRGPASRSTNGKSRARLNHRWVAQLMGFPPDWCDVSPDSDEPV